MTVPQPDGNDGQNLIHGSHDHDTPPWIDTLREFHAATENTGGLALAFVSYRDAFVDSTQLRPTPDSSSRVWWNEDWCWVEQKMGPRFLIHDNDGIFGQHRVTVFNENSGRRNSYRSSLDFWLSEVMGIKGIPIPYGAPNANAHCETCLGTLRRECLDHLILFNRGHLFRTLKEFVTWYNHARYSQAIDGIPDPYPELKEQKLKHGKIVAMPVLNGLHHDYRLAA